MDRMKTLGKYLLWTVLFVLISELVIRIGQNASYHEMTADYIDNSYKIEITEQRATNINGYIGGTITNTSNNDIKEKYIKINLYSQRNVNVGTKYVKIENLKKGESQNFRIGFRINYARHYKLEVVDEAHGQEEEFKFDNITLISLLTATVILMFTF